MKKLGEITLYPPYEMSAPSQEPDGTEYAHICAPHKRNCTVYADCEMYSTGSFQVFPDWPSLRAYVETKMALGILGDEE